jgi:hypothetical protein
MEKQELVMARPHELQRGYLWCLRESGRSVSANGPDFRTLRNAGLLVKRRIRLEPDVLVAQLG